MTRILSVIAGAAILCGALRGTALADDQADPKQTDPDFKIQGEYAGEIISAADETKKLGVQVVAKGHGKFQVFECNGGLPGDGWDRGARNEGTGKLVNGAATYETPAMNGSLKDGVLTLTDFTGKELGKLKRVERQSPTLGAKPPAGAIVLFDGTNVDQFKGQMTSDGLLSQGSTTKENQPPGKLHLEFRLPYMPEAQGQGRGNSGVYLQSRYEVQVLDSFGLKGENNECGGIYGIKAPDQNMCYPPLVWQTYDIDFTPPVYEVDKKVKNARITVRHNGVVIHDNVELPSGTFAAPLKEGAGGAPLYLQDHGNPLRYRNIWIAQPKE